MWKKNKNKTPADEHDTPAPPAPKNKDSFLRPTGAAADAAELEYIIALLRCQPTAEGESSPGCSDISVSPMDVQALLLSRYGVEVPIEKVKHNVFQQGFAVGGDVDSLSLVACLLIPQLWCNHLVQQQQQNADAHVNIQEKGALESNASGKENDLASFVLPRLLEDCGFQGSNAPPQLMKDTLRNMFQKLNLDSPNESLLDDMIQAATDNAGKEPLVLDVATFRRGLSGDLGQWDMYAKSHVSCPFETALQATGKLSDSSSDDDSNQKTTNAPTDTDANDAPATTQSVNQEWEQVSMGRTIDFIADMYYSRVMVVLLYAAFLLTYVAYFFRSDFAAEFLEPTCPSYETRGTWATNRASFFCTVAWAICRFLYIIIGMG